MVITLIRNKEACILTRFPDSERAINIAISMSRVVNVRENISMGP